MSSWDSFPDFPGPWQKGCCWIAGCLWHDTSLFSGDGGMDFTSFCKQNGCIFALCPPANDLWHPWPFFRRLYAARVVIQQGLSENSEPKNPRNPDVQPFFTYPQLQTHPLYAIAWAYPLRTLRWRWTLNSWCSWINMSWCRVPFAMHLPWEAQEAREPLEAMRPGVWRRGGPWCWPRKWPAWDRNVCLGQLVDGGPPCSLSATLRDEHLPEREREMGLCAEIRNIMQHPKPLPVSFLRLESRPDSLQFSDWLFRIFQGLWFSRGNLEVQPHPGPKLPVDLHGAAGWRCHLLERSLVGCVDWWTGHAPGLEPPGTARRTRWSLEESSDSPMNPHENMWKPYASWTFSIAMRAMLEGSFCSHRKGWSQGFSMSWFMMIFSLSLSLSISLSLPPSPPSIAVRSPCPSCARKREKIQHPTA